MKLKLQNPQLKLGRNFNLFMKKLTIIFFGLAALFFSFQPSLAASEEKISVIVFEREECGHCQDEKAFLTELQKIRSDFIVDYHDIVKPEHRQHFDQIAVLEKLPKVTPITIINTTVLQGFDTAETTGKRIIQLLDQNSDKEKVNFEKFLAMGGSKGIAEKVKGGVCEEGSGECALPSSGEFLVNIPFYGALDLKPFSLPIISLILGFVDGFNPCAMWVLVTFLIVLMEIGDKRRMWQIAGLFILAETMMYYLILNVWFTTWDFIGLDQIVTPIIGVIAIGGGFFFLWEGFTSDGTCKVTSSEQKRKTHFRIKELVNRPLTWFTALGVISLAFSVNIIEFACSIGIPQAFTKIIELNHLSFWATQAQMAIYIFFYMIDDFVVFGLALWSFEHLHLAQKYSKYCNILGGVLMLILGYLLIFSPGALRF